MDKVKVKSLYGNDIIIEKVPESISKNIEGYCQIIVNSEGYVLEQNELRKLKDFFQSIC